MHKHILTNRTHNVCDLSRHDTMNLRLENCETNIYSSFFWEVLTFERPEELVYSLTHHYNPPATSRSTPRVSTHVLVIIDIYTLDYSALDSLQAHSRCVSFNHNGHNTKAHHATINPKTRHTAFSADVNETQRPARETVWEVFDLSESI